MRGNVTRFRETLSSRAELAETQPTSCLFGLSHSESVCSELLQMSYVRWHAELGRWQGLMIATMMLGIVQNVDHENGHHFRNLHSVACI